MARNVSSPPPPSSVIQSIPRPGWTQRLPESVWRWGWQSRTPLGWVYLVIWMFYIVSYPIAVTGVAFDVHPGFSMAWAGSILLFVQGILAIIALLIALGLRRGGALALLIALGGYAGEALGVATGFPFGPYGYAHILFPQLPGSVPLPVVAAWLLVVVTATVVARWWFPDRYGADLWRIRLRQIALATLFGAGLDLVLEPVAVHVQYYWVWFATGPYYGIPTTNFIGWAVLCALLAAALVCVWPLPPRPAKVPSRSRRKKIVPPRTMPPVWSIVPAPVWLYAMTVLMFGIIDLTHGLVVASVIGGGILVALALRWRATYHIQ